MCWLNIHWWKVIEGWGMRGCRVCHRREQAIYDTDIGSVVWTEL